MIFSLGKLENTTDLSNLLNNLFWVTEDPHFTRLRSKIKFHVSCRMKVVKVLKFDTSKFGFIIQILAKRAKWSMECAPIFRSGGGSGFYYMWTLNWYSLLYITAAIVVYTVKPPIREHFWDYWKVFLLRILDKRSLLGACHKLYEWYECLFVNMCEIYYK